MTTCKQEKLKKSDDKTNNDKNGVSANTKEYHIISKSIFRRIIIPKFRMIRHYLKSIGKF